MDTNSIGMGGSGLEVVRTLFSLLLVLGMMFAIFFWLKKRGSVPGSAGRRMRIIERLPIDSRRSILLLKVDDEEIVLSVGTDALTPIKLIKKEVPDEV